VLEQVERVASTDSSVLILGETGTGKELIARGIQNLTSVAVWTCVRKAELRCYSFRSPRERTFWTRERPFYRAIAQKIGRFELPDKGTLFLDEIDLGCYRSRSSSNTAGFFNFRRTLLASTGPPKPRSGRQHTNGIAISGAQAAIVEQRIPVFSGDVESV